MTVNFDFLDAPDPLAPKPYGIEKDDTENILARRVSEAFLAGVVAAKLRDWNALAQDWVQHGWNGQAFRNEVSHTFQEVFSEVATGTLVEGALHGHKTAQEDFTATLTPDERVITAWGQVYGSQQAARLALGSEAAVQDIVTNGINSRLPASVIAERAKAAYGLDQRSNNTVMAYLTNKIMPKNQTLLEVMARALIQRSQLMADNEVFAALNFGRQLAYMDAVERGILDRTATKTWVTALDERVCPVCRPMDGVSVPIDQPFTVMMPLPKTGRGKNRKSAEFVVPPVHPLCRCTIVPTERLEYGIITRTARFDDDMFPRSHRARLLSDAGDLVFQKSFDESKHPRDHGKFAHVAEAAVGAALVARSPLGRNILVKGIGNERYFARFAKPVTTPVQNLNPLMRLMVRNKTMKSAFDEFKYQLKPLMSLSEATAYGQPGLYHPRAYAHLQGSTYEETLRLVEEHIRHQPLEHGVLIAPTGKIISMSRGTTYNCPIFFRYQDHRAFRGRMTFTHNHPHTESKDVVLSAGDVANLHSMGVAKIRAITPRGVVTQIRAHPSATRKDAADYLQRARTHALANNSEVFSAKFPGEFLDLSNQKHLDFISVYQSKRMHEFYQAESKNGKFIYSVTQPKVADKAS